MAGLKEVLDRGIASVTVKSSTFLETSKYQNQINIAQQTISKLKSELAENLYLGWKEGRTLDAMITESCNSILEQEQQIEQFKQKIESLKAESQQVLGHQPEPAQQASAPAQDVCFCASCGAKNKSAAKFCYKCGSRME